MNTLATKANKPKITKVKKQFPEAKPMIDTSMVGQYPQRDIDKVKIIEKTYPLVRDIDGDILIAGTTYSRKRQHFPQ